MTQLSSTSFEEALGREEVSPAREERVDQRFEAWLIQHNFGPEQARVWRILKNQMLAETYPPANLDLSVFNQLPPLKGRGGLRKATQNYLGETNLEKFLTEAPKEIFWK